MERPPCVPQQAGTDKVLGVRGGSEMKRCAYCGRQILFGEEVWLVNNEDMYCTAECLANAMGDLIFVEAADLREEEQ